jgi:hypothetical protein
VRSIPAMEHHSAQQKYGEKLFTRAARSLHIFRAPAGVAAPWLDTISRALGMNNRAWIAHITAADRARALCRRSAPALPTLENSTRPCNCRRPRRREARMPSRHFVVVYREMIRLKFTHV